MTIYTLQTPASPDRLLVAHDLAEPAELVECALLAGDRIDAIRAHTLDDRLRTLSVAETHRLVDLMAGLDG